MSGQLDGEPFDDLARHLRSEAGSEFRAEAEATELEVDQGRRRRRRLQDIARESFERGDRVRVDAPGFSMNGRVSAVGRDYLTLEEGERECDVRLDGAALRRERSASGGGSGLPASLTFKARLAEYELSGERLTVAAPSMAAIIEGRITVAATDHLVVLDDLGAEWILPLSAVTMVIRTLPRRH
jgi:hypothetical protein